MVNISSRSLVAGRFTDRMVSTSTYQRFVYDTGLYFFGVFWIFALVYILRHSAWQNHYYLYFGFSFAGLFLAMFIHYRRDQHPKMFFNFNRGQFLLILFNGGVMVYLFLKYKWSITGEFELYHWLRFIDEIMIASWEQMAFGVICPFIILTILSFNKASGTREIAFLFGAILLSSIIFAYAHWETYGGQMLSILYLFLTGTVLMSVCYAFSPSTSIVLHLLNNLIFASKLGG
jgi:membrane protease YdiL (CAAX protease family)